MPGECRSRGNHNLWGRAFRYGCLVALFPLLLRAANAEPAMWVIRGKDSTTYLVGTLHLLRRQAEWTSDKLTKAVHESTDLWLEVGDIDNQAGIVPLLQKYGYDPGKPLSSHLTTEQREKLKKVEQDYNVPAAFMEPMRPWLAALMLAMLPLQKAGFDPNAGVDHLLQQQASNEGDKVRGFETQEEQVRFLADLTEADQIAFLNDTLDDVSEGIALFEKLATAWLKGDSKTINQYLVDEVKAKAPSMYQKLLVDRNVRWADRIAELHRTPGVRLVAVGAGHLVGPDSVQVQLEKKGIKAEPY